MSVQQDIYRAIPSEETNESVIIKFFSWSVLVFLRRDIGERTFSYTFIISSMAVLVFFAFCASAVASEPGHSGVSGTMGEILNFLLFGLHALFFGVTAFKLRRKAIRLRGNGVHTLSWGVSKMRYNAVIERGNIDKGLRHYRLRIEFTIVFLLSVVLGLFSPFYGIFLFVCGCCNFIANFQTFRKMKKNILDREDGAVLAKDKRKGIENRYLDIDSPQEQITQIHIPKPTKELQSMENTDRINKPNFN